MDVSFTLPMTVLGYFFFFLIGAIITFKVYDKWTYKRMYPYHFNGGNISQPPPLPSKSGGYFFLIILGIAIFFFLWLASSSSPNGISVNFKPSPESKEKLHVGSQSQGLSKNGHAQIASGDMKISDSSFEYKSSNEEELDSPSSNYKNHWHLQVGAFGQLYNAYDFKDELIANGFHEIIIITSSKYYHVLVGSYSTKEEADFYKSKIVSKYPFKNKKSIRAVDSRVVSTF